MSALQTYTSVASSTADMQLISSGEYPPRPNFQLPLKNQYSARRGMLLMGGIDADLERKWNQSVTELLQLRSIGSDWDGDGAEAPSPEIIDSIIAMIRSPRRQSFFPAPPTKINILRDGRIALDWYSPGNLYASARFDEPYKAELMVETPNVPTVSRVRIFLDEIF
jgi:hypothetical protein